MHAYFGKVTVSGCKMQVMGVMQQQAQPKPAFLFPRCRPKPVRCESQQARTCSWGTAAQWQPGLLWVGMHRMPTLILLVREPRQGSTRKCLHIGTARWPKAHARWRSRARRAGRTQRDSGDTCCHSTRPAEQMQWSGTGHGHDEESRRQCCTRCMSGCRAWAAAGRLACLSLRKASVKTL